MENMNILKYPSKQTISKLTRELGLKGANEFTQDWEYEVADVDQLAVYVEYYQSKPLSLNERTALMRIILEAYNDYVALKNENDDYGEIIKEFLKRDYSICEEIIKYWACEGEELEDCFLITPFIRNISIAESN